MSSLQSTHIEFNEYLRGTPSTKLSVRLSVSLDAATSQSPAPLLAVYIEDENGEVPLSQTWDELVSLSAPALATVGSRQLLLGSDELEELERAGWSLLVECGHFPTAWREP